MIKVTNRVKLALIFVVALLLVSTILIIYLIGDFDSTAGGYMNSYINMSADTSQSRASFKQNFEESILHKSSEEYENQTNIILGGSNAGDTGNLEGASVLDFTAGGNFECPYGNTYTYMGWQTITSTSSQQYVWRASYFPNWDRVSGHPDAFNSEGFAIVDGRYVVATTHRENGGISKVGEKLDVYLENGNIIKCVVGDIKSYNDATWSKWGHLYGEQVSTIEFIVDKVSWYGVGHVNPGTNGCHPEWKSNIVKIVREEE